VKVVFVCVCVCVCVCECKRHAASCCCCCCCCCGCYRLGGLTGRSSSRRYSVVCRHAINGVAARVVGGCLSSPAILIFLSLPFRGDARWPVRRMSTRPVDSPLSRLDSYRGVQTAMHRCPAVAGERRCQVSMSTD